MGNVHLTLTGLLVGCLALCGCRFGPSETELREKMEPFGVRVNVHLNNGRVPGGELLAVSEVEVGVLTPSGVAIIPGELIERLKVDGLSGSKKPKAGQLPVSVVSRMRPLARFPAGFPPGVLETLLEIHGIYEVTPGGDDAP